MIRRPFALLLPLALLLGGCMDRELPTALPPEGPHFDLAPGHCEVSTTDDAGPGSLRAAISSTACTTITFGVTGTITLTSGQLTIGRDLTITGPGANLLTVARSSAEGTPSFGILRINFGVTTSISGITIANGATNHDGSGVYNSGTLTLMNTTISGNRSQQHGGGIANWGTLTLTNSTVSGNSAQTTGGGIVNWRGALTLIHSTVSGNTAQTYGGGTYNASAGTLTLINSTVSGNSSQTTSGGIDSSGTVTLTNSTVSGNSAQTTGGGIYNRSGTLTLTNSTVSGNSASNASGIYNSGTLTLRGSLIAGNTANISPDIGGPGSATASYSLIGSPAGHGITATAENGNLVGTAGEPLDPKLGPLQDNGGPTRTHALLPGSPAIDHVPQGTNGCGLTGEGGVTEDQRGVSRPQGSGCDIGAFEVEQATTPVFGGFLPPVRAEQINVVKAGSAVPIKFSLGGDFGLQIFADGYPTSVQIACPAASVARNSVSGTTSARASRLTYEAEDDQYNYLWVTQNGWAGTCRQFQLELSDGSTHSLHFSFTR